MSKHEEDQLEIAVAALARIAFLSQGWGRLKAEQIARIAMNQLSALQEKIDQERNTGL